MLRQKKKEVESDDEFDDDEEEDDSLDDEPQRTNVPKPTMFNKPSADVTTDKPTHHVAGEMTTELMDLGNGTFRPVKRVWMNSKESAVSDDPLLVLLCQKLFPQLNTE
jgi:hypothetical protein